MFKNAIVYRIFNDWKSSSSKIEEALAKRAFTPCGATQQESMGFVEPRGQKHGPMLESVQGQWMITLCIETKKVPASVIQTHLIERVKLIEVNSGRKPGKKETRDIKDDILMELLPHAFPNQTTVRLWIDPKEKILVVDASAQGKADKATTELVQALEDPSFGLALMQTNQSPGATMSAWLSTQEAPNDFSIGNECELKAMDESKAVVRYGNHSLFLEEIKQHIAHGKMATKLALTWEDRMSFMLTSNFQFKKLAPMEAESEEQEESGEDRFDSEFFLFTSEFSGLLESMVEALGGETEMPNSEDEESEEEDSED